MDIYAECRGIDRRATHVEYHKGLILKLRQHPPIEVEIIHHHRLSLIYIVHFLEKMSLLYGVHHSLHLIHGVVVGHCYYSSRRCERAILCYQTLTHLGLDILVGAYEVAEFMAKALHQ